MLLRITQSAKKASRREHHTNLSCRSKAAGLDLDRGDTHVPRLGVLEEPRAVGGAMEDFANLIFRDRLGVVADPRAAGNEAHTVHAGKALQNSTDGGFRLGGIHVCNSQIKLFCLHGFIVRGRVPAVVEFSPQELGPDPPAGKA